MQFDLSEQERQELSNLVKAAVADLGPEIHHARDNDYRELLKHRRVVLDGLMHKLEVAQKQC
jgi:hypothetical protein